MKWNNNISRPDNPTRKEVEESVEDLKRKGVVMEHVDGGIYLDLDDDWTDEEITSDDDLDCGGDNF